MLRKFGVRLAHSCCFSAHSEEVDRERGSLRVVLWVLLAPGWMVFLVRLANVAGCYVSASQGGCCILACFYLLVGGVVRSCLSLRDIELLKTALWRDFTGCIMLYAAILCIVRLLGK